MYYGNDKLHVMAAAAKEMTWVLWWCSFGRWLGVYGPTSSGQRIKAIGK
jgi:hypothetical protein